MDCIESLKRAVFIQWYGSFEPPVYTGIGIIDKENEIKNIDKLIRLIQQSTIDEEFKAMVSYYYSLSEWYFDSYGDFIKGIAYEHDGRWQEIKNVNDRGQMGIYWSSLKK